MSLHSDLYINSSGRDSYLSGWKTVIIDDDFSGSGTIFMFVLPSLSTGPLT